MIDLHVHTIYSDGECTVKEILEKCAESNISVLSITDHNILDGTREAIEINRNSNLKVISGIELSADSPKDIEIHILGYNYDVNNVKLNQITNLIREENVKKALSLLELLKKHYKIEFPEYEIEKLFSEVGSIGRPHIAKLMVKYGFSDTVKIAFDDFFKPLRDLTYKKNIKLSPQECIQYIKDAGGIACHAHPITLNMDFAEMEKYFTNLINYGLDAIEVYHSSHSKEYMQSLKILADKLNLSVSVGSDFHGKVVKPDIHLGFGKNNNLQLDEVSILKLF